MYPYISIVCSPHRCICISFYIHLNLSTNCHLALPNKRIRLIFHVRSPTILLIKTTYDKPPTVEDGTSETAKDNAYRCQSPSKTSIKPQSCTEQYHTLILNRDNSRVTRTDMARNGQQPVESRGNLHYVSESPRHKRVKMVQVALLAYILDIISSTGWRLCFNGGNMLC